ncbi:hypothetical protein NMG60_11032974 [Bertholletia excelsa]
MASLPHYLSLLFFSNILILSTTVHGGSMPPVAAACPSFHCGDKHIQLGYPFWSEGQQNDPHCGYPGLALSCTAGPPILRLSGNPYCLKKINYSENSLIISFDEINNSDKDCPIAPHEVRLNSSYLSYTMEDNKMVVFFYNCTLYPPSAPSIACLRHGLMRSYAFLEEAVSEFDWRQYCEAEVAVPMTEAAVDGLLTGGGIRSALEDGFKVTWQPPHEECWACEASGGFCGYSGALHPKFTCFCNGGQQSLTCHGTGELLGF